MKVAEDTLEARVLAALDHELVNASTLADELGIPERKVRQEIELLRNAGELIGSTSLGGGGFFLIETTEELEETARHLTSRARSMLHTVSVMRRGAEAKFGTDAGRLFSLEELL